MQYYIAMSPEGIRVDVDLSVVTYMAFRLLHFLSRFQVNFSICLSLDIPRRVQLSNSALRLVNVHLTQLNPLVLIIFQQNVEETTSRFCSSPLLMQALSLWVGVHQKKILKFSIRGLSITQRNLVDVLSSTVATYRLLQFPLFPDSQI